MTQTEKDLLLKDLCGRLTYGVKVESVFINPDTKEHKSCGIEVFDATSILMIRDGLGEFKPYLFPLSSMTGEQRIELYKVLGCGYESHYHLSKEWEDFNDSIDNNDLFIPATWVSDINKMYNWLNKNHFDYRGLIPMGLANDATGLNIY